MFSLANLVFLFGIFFILYIYLTKNNNYWKYKGVLYQTPTILFGNMLPVIRGKISIGKFVAGIYDKFDAPYFGLYVLLKPVLVIKDPNIIKRILIKDFDKFSDRFIISDEKIDSIFSNSLFAMKQPHWRALRNKLSPVFTSGKIKLMFNLMKECGDSLENYVGKTFDKNLEVKEIAAKYTTDVIGSCAFGINANSFTNEDSEFRVAGRRMFQRSFIKNLQALCYFMLPQAVKIFKFPFINPKAVDFLRKAFTDTMKQREEGKIPRNDLVDTLIQLKNENKDDDEFTLYGDRILAQAVIFFGAGHETTSSAISFTLHELCINVDIQDKLRQEIEEVIEKYGALTYESVQDMKYLDMVVSETLRKYPLTPFLQRICNENYTLPETGLVIEKDTSVLISQHGLHWDPKYFPNPQKYDPERFSEKNKHLLTPYTNLPFGDGPRLCIGERFGLLTTKLGIIYILRKFQVERNSLTQEPLIFSHLGLLQAKGGIRLSFKPLN